MSHLSDLFWAKVTKTSTCWLWTGSVTPKGYGRQAIPVDRKTEKQRSVRAAKYAWEELRGPVPPGWELVHLCDTKTCVRPSHLSLAPPGGAATRWNEKHRPEKCPSGHEYTPENTYIGTKRGKPCRVCKECHKARMKRYHARKAQHE